MLHETFTIELPYEELGIKQQGSATITTYIKDVFPKDQDPFKSPLLVSVRVADIIIILQEKEKL